MKRSIRIGMTLLAVCALGGTGRGLGAADLSNVAATGSLSEASSERMLQSYLLLQEQLHAARLSLDQVREESALTARTNVEFLAARLAAIDRGLALQREHDAQSQQASARVLLLAAMVLAGVGVIALICTAWFPFRARPPASAGPDSDPQALLVSAIRSGLSSESMNRIPDSLPAPEASSERWHGLVDRLETRIRELEAATQPSRITDGSSIGAANALTPAELSLRRANVHLNLDELEEALGCFEEVLAAEPLHPQALVKKATVLERLNRHRDALECYELAFKAQAQSSGARP